MTDKIYYDDNQIDNMIHGIIRQINHSDWEPDYIVGLTRGGLVPALKISHYLNIPMETLKVSLRSDRVETESKTWMAEDAYGYVQSCSFLDDEELSHDSGLQKNILIIDDINDTGATLEWIKNDWQSSCLYNSKVWDNVWGNNVRFAALIDNEASSFEVDYSSESINKTENPQWATFPWECWWERHN